MCIRDSCFPGLFKGALSVRARAINDQMKLAAAYAIADLITDADRSEENIIPGAFDPRVAEAVAAAVALSLIHILGTMSSVSATA